MLNSVGDNIWTVDGEVVIFYGTSYFTRMTLVRLADGGLWLHAPLELTAALASEVSALGEVKYMVAPSKLHHLLVRQWLQAFPAAQAYSVPGLADNPDSAFAKRLGAQPEPEWAEEIGQTLCSGSSVTREVVFFHKPSKTLIVADPIESSKSLNIRQRIVARLAAILTSNGKREAARSLATLLEWQPENIIIARGECPSGGASGFLKNYFRGASDAECGSPAAGRIRRRGWPHLSSQRAE